MKETRAREPTFTPEEPQQGETNRSLHHLPLNREKLRIAMTNEATFSILLIKVWILKKSGVGRGKTL